MKLKLKPDVYKALIEEANKQDRSSAALIAEVIEQYLSHSKEKPLYDSIIKP